jgi:hypothetical protein
MQIVTFRAARRNTPLTQAWDGGLDLVLTLRVADVVELAVVVSLHLLIINGADP